MKVSLRVYVRLTQCSMAKGHANPRPSPPRRGLIGAAALPRAAGCRTIFARQTAHSRTRVTGPPSSSRMTVNSRIGICTSGRTVDARRCWSFRGSAPFLAAPKTFAVRTMFLSFVRFDTVHASFHPMWSKARTATKRCHGPAAGPTSHSRDAPAVAALFGVKDCKVMSSWLHTINVARNICANHSRFWNKPSQIYLKFSASRLN
jgi:hypothetical protein